MNFILTPFVRHLPRPGNHRGGTTAWRSAALAVLAAGITAATPSCQSGRALRPFATDGCSLFPDGTHSRPDAWHSACVMHDIAYWRGGTCDERRAADRKLRADVAARGYSRTAWWMYGGVRLGGSPWWPTPFRWGYGWPWGRGYRPLSESEKAQVAALLPDAPAIVLPQSP